MKGYDYLDVEISDTSGTGWLGSAELDHERMANGEILRVQTLEDATDKNATNVTVYISLASTAPAATPPGIDTIWSKTFATAGLDPVLEDDTVLSTPYPYAARDLEKLWVGVLINTATGTAATTITVRVWFRES